MKASVGGAVLVAIALAMSACAGSRHAAAPPASGSEVAARTVSSSRLILHRQVRCTATVTTPVRAGDALRVFFRVHNVTGHAVKVELGYGKLWLVVHSPDGTTYDTREPLEGLSMPMALPTRLAAGATKKESDVYLRIPWSGPLRITPGCELTALPPLRVGVTTPGPPSDGRTAVADVVAASGHLLDHCRPRVPGVAVAGRIDAPQRSAPPLRTRCSVGLRRERGFLVAELLVVTKPGPRGVHLDRTYEQFAFPQQDGNALAIAWKFVVTRDGATSVDSASAESTRAGRRMAPDWQWTSSGPRGQPGASRCGGTGGGAGGYAGPLVEFVSVCPSR